MQIEYIDIIQPRITDINYGGHLGHIELIKLLHEIRVRFLNQYNLSEANIKDHVLFMRNINVTYKNEAFWGNELEVKMQVRCDKAKIVFDYQIRNLTLNNQTAKAEAAMVLIDKIKKKPVKPEVFLSSFF